MRSYISLLCEVIALFYVSEFVALSLFLLSGVHFWIKSLMFTVGVLGIFHSLLLFINLVFSIRDIITLSLICRSIESFPNVSFLFIVNFFLSLLCISLQCLHSTEFSFLFSHCSKCSFPLVYPFSPVLHNILLYSYKLVHIQLYMLCLLCRTVHYLRYYIKQSCRLHLSSLKGFVFFKILFNVLPDFSTTLILQLLFFISF